MGIAMGVYRFWLSWVWCVKRVLVDCNSLSYHDWKDGGDEKIHHYIKHVTFSLLMNKLYAFNLINIIKRGKRNTKW